MPRNQAPMGMGHRRNFFERFTFCPKSLILREEPGLQKVQESPYRYPLTLAYEFQGLLEGGVVNNRAEIARRCGLSRARVTQVMSLLQLPDRIQEYVIALPAREQRIYSGRQLRELVVIQDREAQTKAFGELVEKLSGTVGD